MVTSRPRAWSQARLGDDRAGEGRADAGISASRSTAGRAAGYGIRAANNSMTPGTASAPASSAGSGS
jgi:hypothetical protein